MICWRYKVCVLSISIYILEFSYFFRTCSHVSDVSFCQSFSSACWHLQGSQKTALGICGAYVSAPFTCRGDPEGREAEGINVWCSMPWSRWPKSITWQLYPPWEAGAAAGLLFQALFATAHTLQWKALWKSTARPAFSQSPSSSYIVVFPSGVHI